jgi:hypothetical protein
MIKELVVWFDQIEMMNVTVTREFRLPVLLSLAGATGLMVLGPALLAFLVVVGRAGRLRRLIEIAWP